MDFNKKPSLEKEEEQEPSLLDSLGFILENGAQEEAAKAKRIGLFGEIDEEKTSEIVYSLNHYKNIGKLEDPEEEQDKAEKKTKKKGKTDSIQAHRVFYFHLWRLCFGNVLQYMMSCAPYVNNVRFTQKAWAR
jgi:hypothetical protein